MPRFIKQVTLFLACSACMLGYAQTGDELLSQGNSLHYDGEYQQAIEVFKKARSIFNAKNDHRKVIESSYAIGESWSNLGKCDSARQSTSEALAKSLEQLGEKDTLTANGYYYLSRITGGCLNDFNEAVSLVRKSSEIRKERFGSESLEIAYDLTMFGYYHTYLGNYDSAQSYLEKALVIRSANEAVDKVELSHTLYYLSKVNERTGDLRTALEQAQEALQLRQSMLVYNHPTVSNSLNDLGIIYRTMGNFDRALSYYLPALEIRKEKLGEDHVNVGASYYTIGNLYGNQFDYRRAISYIKRGNTIINARLGEATPVLHTYYAYLGRMYGYVGDIEEAIYYFNLAEGLIEKHLREDHPYRAIVYNLLGEFYSHQNEVINQVKYLKKAQEIYHLAFGKETVREAGVLVELGKASYEMGDRAKAMAYYEESLEILTKKIGEKNTDVAAVYMGMGDMAQDSDEPSNALSYYSRSLEALSVDSVANDLLIDINSLTHKHRAMRVYQKLAEAYSKLYDETNNRDFLEKSLDRYKYAIDLINFIFDSYELEVSKTQLEKETRSIFEGAIEKAYSLYSITNESIYKEEAFRIVEQSKSPILLSNVADQEVKKINGIPKDLIDEERDIKIEISFNKQKLRNAKIKNDSASIVEYQNKLFSLQSEFEEFKARLEKEYREYFDYNYAREVADINDIRSFLPYQSAVLEYFESRDVIYSFVITQNDFELVKLGKPENFNETVESYIKSLTDGEFIAEEAENADRLYINSATALYHLLIEPSLQKVTSPVNQLVVIPDGTLSNLNFSTMLAKRPEKESFRYSELNYLLRDFSISYAFSSTLNFREISKSTKLSFGGFAPSYEQAEYLSMDSSDHPLAYQLVRNGNLPLPGAISEVSTISEFLQGKPWINEDASETNFKEKSGDYSILHLAMHSLLNSEEPEYSELLFNSANDSLNDGFLTIEEIYNLELNADMIVLSACSSGRGKVQIGEGPISFTRAFSYAGCPSVIMSMWKIPDGATMDIMVEFYRNLKEGKTKDEALRNAQLNYLNTSDNPLFQHPFFWGSLVAMGNTEPVGNSNNRKILALVIGALGVIVFFRIRKRIQANLR